MSKHVVTVPSLRLVAVVLLVLLATLPVSANDTFVRGYSDRVNEETLQKELILLRGQEVPVSRRVIKRWAKAARRMGAKRTPGVWTSAERGEALSQVPWERAMAAVIVVGEAGSPADAELLKEAYESWGAVLPMTARARSVGPPLRQSLRMATWEAFYNVKTGRLPVEKRALGIRTTIATMPISSLEFQAHYLGLRNELKTTGWSPPFEALLRDDELVVRKVAIKSVGRSAPARVRRVLAEVLLNPDHRAVSGHLELWLREGDAATRSLLSEMAGDHTVEPSLRAAIEVLLAENPDLSTETRRGSGTGQ